MAPIWRKALPTATPEEIARETAVKNTLTKTLGRALKILQQNHPNANEPIVSTDTSNTVCDILEAIFIHGLKDTFVDRVTAILSGNVDKIPEPNFWPYLLIFTHKDVISEITHLSRICTDIGRSRAWIRIAINEGLLQSYLNAIVKDKKSLSYYFNHTAYLRDVEQSDILRNYVEGMSVLHFQLSYNIDNLNQWSSVPLMFAGIWAPPLAPEPVTTGVDVVSCYTDDNATSSTPIRQRRIKLNGSKQESIIVGKETDALPRPSNFVEPIPIQNVPQRNDSICSSPASCPDPPPLVQDYSQLMFENLNDGREDELKNIEETVVHDISDNSMDDANHNPKTDESMENLQYTSAHSCFGSALKSPTELSRGVAEGVPEAETSEDLENMPQVGNSLVGKMGWSSSFDNDGTENPPQSLVDEAEREKESFQSLLKNYSPVFGSIIRTPNFSEVLGAMVKNESANTSDKPISPVEPSSADTLEYEVIPRSYSISSKNLDAETQALVNLISTIQNEKGLDSQNFTCKSCSRSIGMIYGKARVCSYDACYYCNDCHDNDEVVIPARVIHNWDFKKYKVAKVNKCFLERVEEEPILDIRKCNPSLYTAIEEMQEILTLRTQLNYLRSYLFACRESTVEELRKKVWPKEYFYEHIHLYAPADLLKVPTGALTQQLTKIVSYAIEHVHECPLCKLKGFICEICSSPKVVYPFEIDSTYRCDKCLAVFHNGCMNEHKPCPKCSRRKTRQGLQDYLWTMDEEEN